MNTARWLIVFLIALGISIPAQLGMPTKAEAIELSLGGFPSYMRTRARYLKNATFVNTLSEAEALELGYADSDDEVFFVDTTLRLTPQLVLSDSVTIRAQVDVFQNVVWAGANSNFLGGATLGQNIVNSALAPSDGFRGALLTGPAAIDTDDQFFELRMLHADIVLPNNLGFVRIGRQPFDWGLGILANGGWDPHSDLGFVLDRFLWLKSWPIGDGTLTQILVSDVFPNGSTLFTGTGKGYDVAAGATIYNNPNVGGVNLTIGAYYFPYIHQDNVFTPAGGPFNSATDLDWLGLYSGLIDLKTDTWRLVGEVQYTLGEIGGGAEIDIDSQFLFIARGEIYPSWPAKVVGAEFGWADGSDARDLANGDIAGQVIVFNTAFNLDQLLFKHIIPNIYQQEGSVINAFYARAYATVKLLDHLSMSPQVIVAWNESTNPTQGPLGDPLGDVDRFLGVEIENTFTWTIHPGVNLDLIGSLVIAGGGLEDLLEAQGSLAANDQRARSAENLPFAIQGRLMIFIDQFLK